MPKLPTLTLALAAFQGLLTSGANIPRDSVTLQIKTYNSDSDGCTQSYNQSFTTTASFGAQPEFYYHGGYLGALLVIQENDDSPNVVIVDGKDVWDGCNPNDMPYPDPSACVVINKDVNTILLSFDGCGGEPIDE